jgi:hypothetical protein
VHRLIDDAYEHWASVCSRNILKSHPGVSGRKPSCTPQMVDDVVDAVGDDDAGEKADEDGLRLDDDAAKKEREEAQVWENLKEAQRWMHVEAYGQHLGTMMKLTSISTTRVPRPTRSAHSQRRCAQRKSRRRSSMLAWDATNRHRQG